MRYLSVCSGIEAASVAWGPLGWQAVAFSEIEPFPCAVLAHHYPDVPNMGDMSKFREWPDELFAEADAIVGGPPCQAFSVAGLRNGLNDDRGNLTLTYAEMIDHADAIRSLHGKPPVIVLYENVPGLLSDKTGAYGCFLAALAGEAVALEPPGSRWTDAGCVFGPKRAIAWRVLDAQYFALAQRRRRVFVVASARDGFDPATVLFEWDGVRRDSPPSRESGKVAPAIPSSSTGGGGLGTDFDCDGGLIARAVSLRGRDGGATAELGDDVQNCLRASGGGGDKPHVLIHADPIARCITTGEAKRQDWETCNFVAHTLKGEGFDASEDGTGRGTPLAPVAFHPTQDPISSTDGSTHALGCGSTGGQASVAVAVALRGREGGAAAELGDEVQNCLRAGSGGGDKPYVLCETLYNKGLNHGGLYASTQETHTGKILRTLREAVGEEAFAQWGLGILGSLQSPEILRQALHGLSIRPAAFSRSWVVHCALSRSENGSGWLLQSLREAGCERCASQGWEPSEQLTRELGAYLSELSQPGAQAARFVRDLWEASEGAGLLRQALSAVQEVGRSSGSETQSAHRTYAVRRLTVEECEFLQGFPRGYTAIPWRKKPASECPDGPRYKALGNSWAVPVVRWIGERINAAVEQIKHERKAA